jgi:hypothetical protein
VEQKAVLESIYRQGIHSPTLDEIERITKQLQAYGEVEEKNVFYWFQNFTAREKQLQKNKKPSQLLLSQREAGKWFICCLRVYFCVFVLIFLIFSFGSRTVNERISHICTKNTSKYRFKVFLSIFFKNINNINILTGFTLFSVYR